MRIFAGLLLITGMCFFTAAASAQGGPPGPHPMGWGLGGPGGFSDWGLAKVVTGEPYTAQAITTMQQTLSDGTTITRKVTASIARDSDGRTMRSQVMSGFGNGHAPNGATLVTIFDPVAHQRIEYDTARKTARIFVLPQGPPAGAPGGREARPGHGRRPGPPSGSSRPNVVRESLPPQTLDGITVQGSKTTVTIAAGAMGNDKPLVSTEERWYSSDLQMILSSTRNDPRFGQTTYIVSNLQQGAPNPSLFQVPAGYQTKTVDLTSHHFTP
jgi:hypothetical protein